MGLNYPELPFSSPPTPPVSVTEKMEQRICLLIIPWNAEKKLSSRRKENSCLKRGQNRVHPKNKCELNLEREDGWGNILHWTNFFWWKTSWQYILWLCVAWKLVSFIKRSWAKRDDLTQLVTDFKDLFVTAVYTHLNEEEQFIYTGV